MFIKRLLNSRREKRAVITQILLPVLITLLGLALAQTTPTQQDDPYRELSLAKDLAKSARGVAYFADFRKNPDPNLWKVGFNVSNQKRTKIRPFDHIIRVQECVLWYF